MSMIMRASILMILMVVAVFVQAGPQGGKVDDRERVWPGIEARKCGAELSVIDTNGVATSYYPPKEYFAQFESETVNQGEYLRESVLLSDVMVDASADRIVLTDCRDRAIDIMLADADMYNVILSGKGLIKLTRHDDRRIVTLQRDVREIRFAQDSEDQGADEK